MIPVFGYFDLIEACRGGNMLQALAQVKFQLIFDKYPA